MVRNLLVIGMLQTYTYVFLLTVVCLVLHFLSYGLDLSPINIFVLFWDLTSLSSPDRALFLTKDYAVFLCTPIIASIFSEYPLEVNTGKHGDAQLFASLHVSDLPSTSSAKTCHCKSGNYFHLAVLA